MPPPSSPLGTTEPNQATVAAREHDALHLLAAPVDAAAALALAHELGAELHPLSSLRAGMARAAQRLGALLGTGGHAVLRVHDWNGSTALVRPWPHTPGGSEEIIDLTQLVTTRSHERPLGMALATLRPVVADTFPLPGDGDSAAWRPPAVNRVLALPIVADGEPVAALELYEPGDMTPAVRQLLDLVALQLSQVAQRELSRADAATTAEHANRLALAASRIRGGVAITDADGCVEWLNPVFTEVTGLLATEVLGRPLWSALAPSIGTEAFVDQLRALFARGTGFRHEYLARHARRDVEYWGEIDVLVMADDTGARAQYVCLCSDITQRRLRELEISEGRDMLTALTENLPISLVVVDARHLSVVSINRHAEVEFGASRAEAAGRSLDDVLGAGVRALIEPRLREALRGAARPSTTSPCRVPTANASSAPAMWPCATRTARRAC